MARSSQLWLGAALVLGASSVTSVGRADAAAYGPADWPMYNYDSAGTRYNSAENTLGTGNVGGLHALWRYPTAAPVSGTPVVVDGVVYAGDMAGIFYAVRSSDGSLVWSAQLKGQVTASALVTKNVIVVGDTSGNLYGLNRTTGAIRWSMRPDAHPLAAIWGSPTAVSGDHVAVGVASNEEFAAKDPNYHCCSTRGSMVVLEPNSGTVIWQTFTITDAERAAGMSGSSIWSTPTYDKTLGLIYATTGNNFSQPTNGTSDAIMAFDAHDGHIVWVNQRSPNDEWNFRFPYSPDHPDADFGDSAQVYTLANGRRVVGAGQKSGFYHVVDAQTGALIRQNQFEVGGTLGGLFADSAVANGVVFANGVNWTNTATGAPAAGDLFAISGDGSFPALWDFKTQYLPATPSSPALGSPDFGGVAVANGVVYFTSWGISFVHIPGLDFSGSLYALDAATGTQLRKISLGSETSTSGPAVSRGRVYVGTGDSILAGFGYGVGPGSITAFGL